MEEAIKGFQSAIVLCGVGVMLVLGIIMIPVSLALQNIASELKGIAGALRRRD